MRRKQYAAWADAMVEGNLGKAFAASHNGKHLFTTTESAGDEILRAWLLRPGLMGEWFVGVPLWDGLFVLVRCCRSKAEAVAMVPSQGWE